MVNVGHVIEGAANAVLKKNSDISEERMEICKNCPLYTTRMGGMCNSKLWLDPQTGDISLYERPGYYKGCGCKLDFKTRVRSEECPAGKW